MKRSKSILSLLFVLALVYIIYIGKIFFSIYSVLYRTDSQVNINSIFLTSVKITNCRIRDVFNFDAVDTNLKIKLSDDKLNDLNSNLAKSGFKYKKAEFVDENNNVYQAKVRYRGDLNNHWAFPKKSWRIKITNNKLYKGNNVFNLIKPKFKEQINNHFSYLLAKNLGVLSPNSFMTNLKINNQYEGIKVFVEQLNDFFLIKNKRRGNLYKGDHMGSNRIKGTPFNDVFDASYYWKKLTDKNNLDTSFLKTPLFELSQLNLNYFNIEMFAKFSAFQSLANTYHIDHNHNWILFYDSLTQKIEPVCWDPVGWGFDLKPNKNIIMSKVYAIMYNDFDFYRKTQGYLGQFYNETHIKFLKQMDYEKEYMIDLINKNDYHFTKFQDIKFDFFTREEQLFQLEKGIEKIKTHLNNLNKLSQFEDAYWGVGNKNQLSLTIKTLDIIEYLVFSYEGKLKTDYIEISILSKGRVIKQKYLVEITEPGEFKVKVNLLSDYNILNNQLKGQKHLEVIETNYCILIDEKVEIKNVKGLLYWKSESSALKFDEGYYNPKHHDFGNKINVLSNNHY